MRTRISFTGDILCEAPMLRACRRGKAYDFGALGFDIKKTYGSDLVIGNLETVFAGPERGYTDDFYSFNTPDSFVTVLKNLGVDCVTTANNHCLDRGTEGLRRTLDVLDANGIRHTGTYRTAREAEAPLILTVNGLRLGLVACTYGTNYEGNRCLLSEDEQYAVSLMLDQTVETPREPGLIERLKERLLTKEQRTRIVRALGLRYNAPQIDGEPLDGRRMERLAAQLRALRPQCDLLVVCPHMGGQFNPQPGSFSRDAMDFFLRAGADAVIGNHAHIVQRCFVSGGRLGCYCLGNLVIPPDCAYLLCEDLPAYSVIVHLDVEDGRVSYAFSIARIEGGERRGYRLSDAFALCAGLGGGEARALGDDCRRIFSAFTGAPAPDVIEREYPIP